PVTRRITPEILNRSQHVLDAAQVEFDQDLAAELKLEPPHRLALTVHAPEVRNPAEATLAYLLTLVVEPGHQRVAAEHKTCQPVASSEGLVTFLEAASVASVANEAVQVFQHRHPALDVGIEIQTRHQQLVGARKQVMVEK